jgi:hypothetical protein
VAQFRNVSGADLNLALPFWYDARLVEAGAVVDVDDDELANYAGVGISMNPQQWEHIDAPAGMVGEHGPELTNLPAGTPIAPATPQSPAPEPAPAVDAPAPVAPIAQAGK